MLDSIKATLNPTKGGGTMESVVVYILLVAVIAMNFIGVEVSEEVHWSLYLILGYMFGTNNNPKWDGVERREDDINSDDIEE